MAPKFGASKESLEGFKPVPSGVYLVKLEGFEPKLSKNGDSINLNAILKIQNDPQHNGVRVFCNLNQKAGFILQDFSHCFGLPMEMVGEDAHLPGGPNAWKTPPNVTDEKEAITKTKYEGPLLNRMGKIEVVYIERPGQKPRNEIKQFICAIDGCATKFPEISHATNLIKQ